MITDDNKKCRKVPIFFECNLCDYITSQKSHYEKHLGTLKHQNRSNGNPMVTKVPKSAEKCRIAKKDPLSVTPIFHRLSRHTPYKCECGQEYKFKSGLSRHKKKCNITCEMVIPEPNEYTPDKKTDISDITESTILEVLKQNNAMIKENTELKCLMMETQNKMCNLLEQGTHNMNSHNKTFNLNFFLNDTCKDAMNITDFVETLKIRLQDLEKMGEIGYVNGLSNIIVNQLKNMDVASRPIHCTDIKREILYIKDEDKWDKEVEGHPKVKKVIQKIAHKNSKLMTQFKEKYPEYNNSSSRVSDKYNKLLIETMGGKGDNEEEKVNKIIKNVSKEITVK